MVKFLEVEPGQVREIRDLPDEAVAACPFLIIHPSHYREDDTCRCNDEGHTEMKEWGYHWSKEKQRWM